MSPLSPYRLYWENLKKHSFFYSIGMFAMLVTSLSEVLLPKFIQWALDLLNTSGTKNEIPDFFWSSNSHDSLNRLCACLVAILFLGWIGRVGWRQILARQTHLAGHDIKTRIWSVLKDQPVSLLDRYSLGDLMNRSTADWNKTRFIHGFTIVLTFDLIFFSILAVVSMFLIDKLLALCCLLIIPFLPRKIIGISKQEYQLHQHAQEQLSSLSELISQTIKTIRLQRATASEEFWKDRLDHSANEYATRQYEVLRTGWKIFIWGAVPTFFAYLILFSLGIWKLKNGEISLGGFVALQSYVLLLQSPLFELGSLISEWQTGFASYHRITELYALEHKAEATDFSITQSDPSNSFALKIKNLTYSYDCDKVALNNISFTLKNSQKIGIIGRIGSGKSTLLNMIAGLLDDIRGDIQIFGKPLSECNREWIVKHISIVPQKPFLFAGTIQQNLDPKGEVSEEKIHDVLDKVELSQDIKSFPLGIKSWIGEAGINLSGGQKQRLALARALLKSSPLLLIDDGLSAVDSITEARILEKISFYLSDRAVLWTAHRQSTLQLCDKIFLMEFGRLSESHIHSSHGKLKISTEQTVMSGV